MIYAAKFTDQSIKFVEKFSRKVLAEEYRDFRMKDYGERIILVKEPERKRLVRAIKKMAKQKTVVNLDYGGTLVVTDQKIGYNI